MMMEQGNASRGPLRRRLETVVFPRPRCPACGGVRLLKYRSLSDQGDGSALWWVRCGNGACGRRFRVLLEVEDLPAELPDSGTGQQHEC